jgi:hypothetical protein
MGVLCGLQLLSEIWSNPHRCRKVFHIIVSARA